MLGAAPLAGQTGGTHGPPRPSKMGVRKVSTTAGASCEATLPEPNSRTSTTPPGGRSICRTIFSVEDLPPRPADMNGEGALWGTTVTPVRIGPFDTELSAGTRDTGWFVGGTGWYRKRFPAPAVPADGQVEIVFDGVYMNSDVWLNGKLLGYHPYGYTAFATI